MRKILLFAGLLAVPLMWSPAEAQQTVQVCVHSTTTSSCAPVNTSNGFPVNVVAGGAGGGNVNLTGINGVTVSTGSGTSGTGTQRIAEAAATPTSSTALVANQVICGSACQLTSFEVMADSTLSGAAWQIQIYNATSAPADGAVTPVKCYQFPSGASGYTGAFPAPINFSTGVVIGVSTGTSCQTKAASTHATFISGDSR